MKRAILIFVSALLLSTTVMCGEPSQEVQKKLDVLDAGARAGQTLDEVVKKNPGLFMPEGLFQMLITTYLVNSVVSARDILSKTYALIELQRSTFTDREEKILDDEYKLAKDFIETVPVRHFLLKAEARFSIGTVPSGQYSSWNKKFSDEVASVLPQIIDVLINKYNGKITTSELSSIVFGLSGSSYEDSIFAVGQKVDDDMDILIKLKTLKAVIISNSEEVFFNGKMMPLIDVLVQNTELAKVFLGYSDVSSLKLSPREIRYFALEFIDKGADVKGMKRLEYVNEVISKR